MAQTKNASRYIQFYTEGSAAQKVQLVDEREWAPLPEYQVRRKKVIHIDPVAIVGILAAAFLMITMMLGVTRLVEIREQTAQMQEQVIQLQAENRELSQKYAESYDLAVIENTALNMGMIPSEQANRITIHVPVAQQPEQVPNETLWGQIGTFLTGLFA